MTTRSDDDVRTFDFDKTILQMIAKPGKVHVHTVLDVTFPVEKQAAIEYVKRNPNGVVLMVWPDGYKQLELKD